MPFYAVAVGKVPGVYNTWEECQNQTKQFPRAKFRKFNTEAEAKEFVKNARSLQCNSSVDVSRAVTSAINIENLNPPEMTAVASYPSQSLLKQDRLSLIAEKLDKFIEQTNKKINEFSNRLDIIETSIFNGSNCEGKRKNESSEEVKPRNKSKKKKIMETVELSGDESQDSPATRSTSQSASTSVEEVDGAWRGSNQSPQNFIVDQEGYVIVYTDGACSNNGKTGAKAGVGVWFNHNHPFNVAGPVEGTATNNNAEIQAATRAIQQARLAGLRRLNIHTDSQFMINCITEWIKRWKRNNWMTANGGPVKNKEQLMILDKELETLDAVKWTHVRGHAGHEGNECADALARSGASMY